MQSMRAGLATAGVIVAFAFILAAMLTRPAAGFIPPPTPPPAGVAVVVNTTSDLTNPGDGTCSLRAAIAATNINGHAGNCDATGSKAGATDGIRFDIGPGAPVISVGATPLPAITDKLSIDGNSGGASKVVLHGPGAGVVGLYLQSTASNSVIAHMVINNFDAGLVSDAPNTKLLGNFIGTDASGTVAVPNVHDGVQVLGSGAVIGGTNGTTPGGSCTGDCNLISGNPQWGIFVGAGGNSLIEGNLIGTDVSGEHSIPNQYGIYSNGPGLEVGGTTAAARNVVSGNSIGITLNVTATVQGNFIGTDASGASAIPNGDGIELSVNGATIGGEAAGAGDLISGNSNHAIEGYGSTNVNVYGNVIGLAADGVTALPNATCKCDNGAIVFRDTADSDRIGGTGPGQANIIADNSDNGVRVCACGGSPHVTIRGNSIFGNTGVGILLEPGANSGISPPVITAASYSSVSGTASCAYCTIDVYSDGGDEGRIYEGSVDLPISGAWQLTGAFHGPNMTATATDGDSGGYGIHNTSQFSALFGLPATPTPTPSASPTPTAAPSPTPTPTPTPAPTATPTPTPTPAGQTPTPTRRATATPTPSPNGQERIWGDLLCGGGVTAVGALDDLRDVAGLSPLTPTPLCPALGATVEVEGFSPHTWGDVNCDGQVTAVDSLDILRFVAGLSQLPKTGHCPDVGQQVTVAG